MTKLKTKRSAAKRFRLTGKGKIKRMHACASHILTKKTSKRKRKLRKWTVISSGDEKRVKRMLNL